jgi:L-lactate utilization protein LutC
MSKDARDVEKNSIPAETVKSKETKQDTNKSFIVTHWQLVIILLLVIAVAGMYVWKNVAVNSATVQLTDKADRIITEQNRTFLRLAVVPLVWAVRSEMIRDNYDQINQYLNEFVKEQNMKEIVVAKPDGTIVVATNKKFEGTSVAGAFPPSVLQEDKLTVSSLENGDIMVVSPVMGLSAKVGVLILLYTPASYTLQTP